ncbi:MAG: N-acetylmannosamine-6-phosphate 2-epimerase [Peptoniphilaceae bacterium]
MNKENLLKDIKNGLIVSCQALEDEAMYSEEGGVMPLFAEAARRAGAVGIRANSVRDIKEIKEKVNLPIIGIIKKDYPNTKKYITVTMEEVDLLVGVGVEVIAIDATLRDGFNNKNINEFVKDIRAKYPNQLLMADIATYEEGVNAQKVGFDFVGTTLSGYTKESEGAPAPNFELVKKLSNDLNIPVIAEGHVSKPEYAKKMLEEGAYSVVVGGAITRPQQIAESFVNEMSNSFK